MGPSVSNSCLVDLTYVTLVDEDTNSILADDTNRSISGNAMLPAEIATDSIPNRSSAYRCVQLVPKYTSKVKLSRGQSPNILSEIIKSQ